MCFAIGDQQTIVTGGISGHLGVYSYQNKSILIDIWQFSNKNVLDIQKLKKFQNYYAFSTHTFGLYLVEINLDKKSVNCLRQFLQGKVVSASYEFEQGKLLCILSSTNEIWIVDYITLTEEKLRDTYDKVLSIQPLILFNKALLHLYLVRETEWICILNIKTNTYTRILRIPYYMVSDKASNNLIALLPPIPNVDEEIYNFALVWGD